MRTRAIPLLILLVSFMLSHGQKDTANWVKDLPAPDPYYRNVIKFNPSPMLFLGDVRNLTFSYERILKNNQSVAVQAGYLLFPRVVNDTLLRLIHFTESSKQGVNLAFDYRYYPWKRNRRPVPDGLYLGAFFSYYGFNFRNHFDILKANVDENGTLNGNINIYNLGLELGYQFVFWKRLTLDLILFGPAFSRYHTKVEISGNLNKEEIGEISDELAEKLMNRFPVLSTVFSEDGLVVTGSRSKFGIGFRYSIQVGFHF